MLRGKANHAQYSNDLYWTCYIFDNKNSEWFRIKFYGYNDSYWWDNVSEKARRKTVKGDKGTQKTFELDYKTLEVVEVEE